MTSPSLFSTSPHSTLHSWTWSQNPLRAHSHGVPPSPPVREPRLQQTPGTCLPLVRGWGMPPRNCATKSQPLTPAMPVSPPASPPGSEAAVRSGAWRCCGNPSTSGGGSQTCPVGWWFRRSGRTPCSRPGTEPAGPVVRARSARAHWQRRSSPSVGWDAHLGATNSAEQQIKT